MSDETPAPPDDDEFGALPPPSRPKSPLLAVAVIGLAAVVCWHLRHEVAYAFAPRVAADLGEVRTLAARGVTLPDNRYVTIAGQPERRYALYIEPRGASAREALFRLLGSQSRLFVRASDSAARNQLVERWTGRLRRFDDLSYAQSLRDYYAHETEVTRFLAPDSVKAALGRGDGAVVDRTGAPSQLAAEQPLVFELAHPGQLQVWLSKDKFPSLADAAHELDHLKLTHSAGSDVKDEFSFIVDMPDARKNEIVNALSDEQIAFQPYRQRVDTRYALVRLAADGTLQLGAPDGAAAVTASWAQVESIGLPAPVEIGHDAFVLSEGEEPSAYDWAPALCGLLVAFALFNLWYLLRALRASA